MLDTNCADTIKAYRIPGDELNAFFNAGWKADSIYFFFSVTDDTLNTSECNSWDNDGIELFFDGNHSLIPDDDDIQIRIEYTDPDGMSPGIDGGGVHLSDVIAGMNYLVVANQEENDYVIEVVFNMEVLNLPAVDQYFGFEIAVHENDNFGRTGVLRWYDQDDDSYKQRDELGKAMLKTGQNPVHIDVPEKDNIVADFTPEQNYPNPFNPLTTIRYRIIRATRIKLIVYNIAGEKVITQ